ncbi:hypothetical protein [Alicyclobacillus dauci]|uniref:Uncharacterized protein n=1 Tax=Alicyclobacillus dauci TaxID=1475485 RepID=A0ABY6Z9N8_9BACL|nr:hypothetical protein [Alicyclobacillus dauci]WAH39496.1 hypothetical protein NZD86_24315 [Alicyclobacillus dauci]WAH39556.1 hypothetical protein NZD86_24015 [Alicyclobacillus dauci]
MKVEIFFNGEPWHDTKWDCIPRIGDRFLYHHPSGDDFHCVVDDVVWVINDRLEVSPELRTSVKIKLEGNLTLLD